MNAMFNRIMSDESIPEDLRNGLREEWTPTPWMVDVDVGNREDEIRHWLYHAYGPESSPMHGCRGLWKRGSVTMGGRTWYGFRRESLLVRFDEKFGTPSPK